MQRSVERARGAWTKAEPYVRKDGTATRSTTVYLPVELLEQLRAEMFSAMKFAEPEIGDFLVQLEGA